MQEENVPRCKHCFSKIFDEYRHHKCLKERIQPGAPHFYVVDDQNLVSVKHGAASWEGTTSFCESSTSSPSEPSYKAFHLDELHHELYSIEKDTKPKPDAVDGFLLMVEEAIRRLPYRRRCEAEIKILQILKYEETSVNLYK
ncbi:unnamed protein product [Brassicogethes aeneus]|uniref:BESS domain-containing protein n=1 Tax=Brassicogethes aeneus TaxID=1431903 RepID=A0A9P0FCG7_BRAAE|nr:unnamed protein product [Brassicogethes aeneus]